jgi:hypothetical protein
MERLDVARRGARRPLATLALVTLAAMASVFVAADKRLLYRYVNEEGVTVIDYSVPPDAVSRGYEVINPDGTVRRVVPRTLTAEERAVAEVELVRERERQAEEERLRAWDQSLMRRYSSTADIEAARDRELRDLEVRIAILRSNVRSLKQQVSRNQSDAADIERSGKQVPGDIVSNIDSLQVEIVQTEQAVEERQAEIEVVRQGYARDMARFEKLLGQVELRRRYSVPAADTPD